MPEVVLSSVIVGTKFKGSPAVTMVGTLMPGDEIQLKREPNNRADRKAVACHYGGLQIGYLPRSGTQTRVSEAMDLGTFVRCTVREAARVLGGRVVAEPKLTVAWHEP